MGRGLGASEPVSLSTAGNKTNSRQKRRTFRKKSHFSGLLCFTLEGPDPLYLVGLPFILGEAGHLLSSEAPHLDGSIRRQSEVVVEKKMKVKHDEHSHLTGVRGYRPTS